jgi:hypothetical protein
MFLKFFHEHCTRVSNFQENKKLYPEEGKEEKMGISDGIPADLRNKKLLEFRSEPFRRREKRSEFHTLEQK